MVSITRVWMWKNYAFLESDYEIPKIDAMINQVATIDIEDTFIPPKDKTFSRLNVKRSWEELRCMNYIGLQYTMSSGEIIYIYGWIDSVTMLSDSADAPLCQIDWHIDYWRTYKKSITFGKGLVKRKPYFSAPQISQPIYWVSDKSDVMKFEGSQRMTDTTGQHTDLPMYWLYISYVGTSGSYTKVDFYCTPLPNTISYVYVKVGSIAKSVMSLSTLLTGTWEEKLGLDPTKIKGAWILPMPPEELTGEGTETSPYQMTNWSGTTLTNASVSCFQLATFGYSDCTDEFTASLTETDIDAVVTSDLYKYVITGFDCEIVGELPWGFDISKLKYRVCLSANSCYMQIRETQASHTVGLCYTIPAPVVDTIENAVSTYNYSGQRDYDLQMRQMSVWSQVAGASSSAIGGAIAGGTSGAGAMGIAAGAVSGAGLALGGAALNQFVFNPMQQESKDALVAKQSAGLLLSGSSILDIIWHGRAPRLVRLKADDATISRWKSKTTRFGYECNVNYDSCQSLIATGGPLQISNLTISGDAPSEAKVYIKSLFERGVNLI
jgi:hypothetical protein